jgi:Flp pilus assembly protein TadB
MPGSQTPAIFYQQRIATLEKSLKTLTSRRSLLGWARLLTVLAGAATIWLVWASGGLAIGAAAIFFIVIFLFLVSKDQTNMQAISEHDRLIHINKQELLFLNHQFTHQPDGHQFFHEDHPSANDLDIFGRASIFQFINRTGSQQGNALLANWLSHPADTNTILARQKAVQELTTQSLWRQELQAHSKASQLTIKTEKTIEAWLQEPDRFSTNTWKLVRFIVPTLAVAFTLTYIFDIITFQQFLPGIILFFIIASAISRAVNPLYLQLNTVTAEMETLSNCIACIERASFRDPLLNDLTQYFQQGTHRASKTIKTLNQILNRFDYRLNPVVFVPLNTLFLWDLQQALQLEQWKRGHNQQVTQWFHTLAELEALSSLATLAFNHPNWCYPTINTDLPEFTATDLGHPLIEAHKSVLNSFSTLGTAQINIITGSNMAGKSTFLRSVGVNLVLANMGAPVCASSLRFSPLRVMSSMRIADNLEESTSTFYAELKKLKSIIDAVKNNEPVFILLDEILRGTNSADRHKGSKALIRQMLKDKAIGIIATHDLELASLSKEFPNGIHNYHFDVQVEGEELHFDYKLKTGICGSLNASILMRKIGIELAD